MIISLLVKSFTQLNDPPIRAVLIKTLLLCLVLFAGILAVSWFALSGNSFFDYDWLNDLVDWLGEAAIMMVSLLMFPSIAVLILGFYLEDIASAVEDKCYPELGPGREQPFRESIVIALKFALAVIIFNIPVLFFLLIPPLFPVVFYVVNGYLLGREYFELVALRRLDETQAKTLRKAYRGRLILGGAALSFLATLPVINLLVPVIATIMMVHAVNALREEYQKRIAPLSDN